MASKYEMPKLFEASERGRAPAGDVLAEPDESVGATSSMRFMSQLADGDATDEAIEVALSGFPSFRRADAEGSLEAVDDVPEMLAVERRSRRRQVRACLIAIAVLAFASLLVDSQGGFFGLAEACACYELAFKQFITLIMTPSAVMSNSDIIAVHESYFRVLDSLSATFAAAFCGAATCVGGLLFQASFQRRFAVAPIVGVSAAVLACQGIALLAVGSVLGISWVALLVACAVGFAPTFAVRFRLNALNLSAQGARQLGIDQARLRRLADGCAIALLVVAQVRMGPVFALALTIPPLARILFGAEFRKALAGSVLLGVISLLVARLIPVPLWITASIIAAAAFKLVLHDRDTKRYLCYITNITKQGANGNEAGHER